ncbi:MAG: hypothetical protein CMI03_14975 [Oceanospirillaceae bacterium]|uniref:OmpH family outer membrane protein n=1 Tax=unclassified Thalassolituus TaxID=2624967 RepID=UPI000C624C7D|nr:MULTISPECIES: OmpH family outer membrane protein [unclassified Thalassolituus]MBL35207.1 hypothetical protein [Oceanospirillaceae bacterium]MBS54041.1 hypothetical protein [Oceanospirillaceae bacterium]|tara:strand:- start:107 stop:598 length:492 start_codon:yes stop_codon:yes gene_type:complete
MRWLLMVLATVFVQVAAAETKIAVVDMERALFLSDAAKSSYQQFQNDNKRDVDQLKSLEADLISIREKREKDGAVMSTDEMNKLQSEFEEKGKEYQFYQRKLQQLDQKWKRDFFQSKLPDLEKLLKAIIDEGGYDVVYQAGAVVYANPDLDLTKLLLERLNAK